MSFPPAFLDQLRSRLSIAETVGRRVRLVKRGREHTGLCPFHNEKSPSFTVSEDKGFFHCFGCGAHGDIIGFVMRSENLTFPETVERLAAEAGLEVPRMAAGDREKAARLSGLAGVMDLAAKWFESQLSSRAGAAARDYVQRRGLSDETVARFRLGLAPNSRTALKEAMLARGATEAQLVESGMLIRPEDGGPSYDRFRDRLMFPIGDRRGRIVAFGGRALGDAPAKYLNSPETPLFHKGRMLYNHALAREAAPGAGTVVVAEGYMDVIALAQAGFAHAVAPLGTALTEEQMGELWRLAAEPILCFDGDAAGFRAALRAAERCLPLLKPGRSFRFALLPEGKDPDDLIRDKGPPAMAAALGQAIPLADLLWRTAAEARPLDTPERRAGLKQELDRTAAVIADPDVREHYQREFRNRLQALFQPPRGPAAPARQGFVPGNPARRRGNFAGPPPGRPLPAAGAASEDRRERLILVGLLRHPELLDRHEEEVASLSFRSRELDSFRSAILQAASRSEGLDSATLARHLTEAGWADTVARLAGPNVRYQERFAQPGTDWQTVEAGWIRALAPFRRKALERDLEEAKADVSEAGFKRLQALRTQLEEFSRAAAELAPEDDLAAPSAAATTPAVK